MFYVNYTLIKNEWVIKKQNLKDIKYRPQFFSKFFFSFGFAAQGLSLGHGNESAESQPLDRQGVPVAPILLSLDSTDIKLFCQTATRVSNSYSPCVLILPWPGDNSQAITSLQVTPQEADIYLSVRNIVKVGR